MLNHANKRRTTHGNTRISTIFIYRYKVMAKTEERKIRGNVQYTLQFYFSLFTILWAREIYSGNNRLSRTYPANRRLHYRPRRRGKLAAEQVGPCVEMWWTAIVGGGTSCCSSAVECFDKLSISSSSASRRCLCGGAWEGDIGRQFYPATIYKDFLGKN